MDIQVGDKVTFEDGCSELVLDDEDIMNVKTNSCKIIKIERPKYEVVEEKKELLTEQEKEFLKSYIKLIENLNNGSIISIYKQSTWIMVTLDTQLQYQAEIGPRFKNLKECNIYTLEELGVE